MLRTEKLRRLLALITICVLLRVKMENTLKLEFTELCGKPLLGLLKADWKSTTKTLIESITVLTIWNFLPINKTFSTQLTLTKPKGFCGRLKEPKVLLLANIVTMTTDDYILPAKILNRWRVATMAYGMDITSSGLLMRFRLRLLVMAMRVTCGLGSTPNSGAISIAKL